MTARQEIIQHGLAFAKPHKSWDKFQACFDAEGRGRTRTFERVSDLLDYAEKMEEKDWKLVRIDRVRKDIIWLDKEYK